MYISKKNIDKIQFAIEMSGYHARRYMELDRKETKYFNGTPQKNYQIKKGEVLKQFITDFIRKYKNVKYTFYTNSNFNPNLSNVKVIGEKDE